MFVQVHNIVDKACKEMAMEKMLRDLEVTTPDKEINHIVVVRGAVWPYNLLFLCFLMTSFGDFLVFRGH